MCRSICQICHISINIISLFEINLLFEFPLLPSISRELLLNLRDDLPAWVHIPLFEDPRDLIRFVLLHLRLLQLVLEDDVKHRWVDVVELAQGLSREGDLIL